jgi:hypothetical protein
MSMLKLLLYNSMHSGQTKLISIGQNGRAKKKKKGSVQWHFHTDRSLTRVFLLSESVGLYFNDFQNGRQLLFNSFGKT